MPRQSRLPALALERFGKPLDELVRGWYAEGIGATAIAKRLGISYPTARTELLRAGVALRKPGEWAPLKSGAGNPMFEACKAAEHREKLRQAQLHRYATKGNALRGRPLSPSHRAAIYAAAPRGPAHPSWKGGYVNAEGYRLIQHNGRRRYEHRVVMELHLGRTLSKREHVHHINHDRLDNRIENLRLMTAEEHSREHIGDRERGKARARDFQD